MDCLPYTECNDRLSPTVLMARQAYEFRVVINATTHQNLAFEVVVMYDF